MRSSDSKDAPRVRALFDARRLSNFRQIDKLFAVLMLLQWIFGIIIALLISPKAWSGTSSQTHVHVWSALFLGGAIISLPLWLVFNRSGESITRHCVAIGQMLTSALLIHLTGGRIETHFHVFGSIAFLALYRDWPVLITATVTVALDHLLRGIFWPQSVYGVLSANYLRFLEHAGWVSFEVFFLARACRQSLAETRNMCEQQVALETANETLRNEAEERERTQNALAISEDRFQLVVSATRDTIWDRDLVNNTVWRNENFQEMSGFSPLETRGDLNWWIDLVHPEDRESLSQSLTTALAKGDAQWSYEYRLSRKDGSYATVLDRARILRDSSGKAVRMVGATTDLSLIRELQEAKIAAESATRAKSEFLANMSHEIRTPLNGIIGMTQLALETNLDAEQQEYLMAVDQSSQALLSVINDVLDFSKIEARKLDFDFIQFNLQDAVEDSLNAVALAAHRKGLELACRIQPEVPHGVIGDPGRLRQILINLIGNAVKFTPVGDVIVQVQCESIRDGRALLHFSVSDTGVGIAADKQALIFEAFAQADTSVTREYGGTGLGLAISSALVRMMNGKMWLESQLGQGSTFHFTADLAIGQSPTEGDKRVDPADLRGLRALVVDDHKTNRRILEEVLNSWQLYVECADSGRAALDKLRAAKKAGTPFSLVLTDAHMPDIDGFELALRMRHNPEAQAAILMLTSDMKRGDTARCHELGIRYLIKPVRQAELFNAIGSLGGTMNISTRLIEGGMSTTPTSSIDALSVLLAEDNIVNQRLAVKMLEKHGHTVTVVENGLEAVKVSEKERFDVVLMDVQMPGMDGLQATSLIRERDKTRNLHTPIIALTAHAMKGDRERCIEAGMDGYVSKPMRPAELFEAIEKILPGAKDKEAASPKGADHSALFDLEALRDRFFGDEELLRELAALFLSEQSTMRKQISTAVASRDCKALAHAAHTLKGSMGTFAPKIGIQTAAELEKMGYNGNLAGAEAVLGRMERELDAIQSALVSMTQGAAAGGYVQLKTR